MNAETLGGEDDEVVHRQNTIRFTQKAGTGEENQVVGETGEVNRSPITVTRPSENLISIEDTQTSGRSAEGTSRCEGSNENDIAPASETLLHSNFCPDSPNNNMQNLASFGETHQITPEEITSLPPVPPILPLKCNCAFWRRQAERIQNANSDVISIIHLASLVGWDRAEHIGSTWGLKYDPSVRATLETKER